MQSMSTIEAVILLGSNLGDRQAIIQNALKRIEEQCGNILQLSSLYESEPWGFVSSEHFLNQVALISTQLKANDLLDKLLEIEKVSGRNRTSESDYVSRILDLDILYYGNLVIETDTLSIPHPRLHMRRFTLMPLCEIMPDFVHPGLKMSQRDLLDATQDHTSVSVFYESSTARKNV